MSNVMTAVILFFATNFFPQGCQAGILLILAEDMPEYQNQQWNIIQT